MSVAPPPLPKKPRKPLQPTGALLYEHSFYIERTADHDLFRWLTNGHYCFVAGPPQIGKSSLRENLRSRLRQQNIERAALDLASLPNSPIRWFEALIGQLAEQLGLSENEQVQRWQNCSGLDLTTVWLDFLRLIGERNRQVVLLLDEVNAALAPELDVAPAFLAGLRGAYSSRGEVKAFRHIAVCLFGTVRPGQLLGNHTNRWLLTEAQQIRLVNFTQDEAWRFHPYLEEAGDAKALIDEVYSWTAGYPYLTHRLCFELERGDPVLAGEEAERVKELVYELFLSPGRLDFDFLQLAKQQLENERKSITGEDLVQEVLRLYRRVLQKEDLDADERSGIQQELLRIGLCRFDKGKLVLQNRITAAVFDSEWVKKNITRYWLEDALDTWRRNGKPTSYLLPDWMLAEAKQWLAKQAHPTPDELEFIRSSDAEVKRVQRRLKREVQLLRSLVIAVVMILILAGYQFLMQRELNDMESNYRKLHQELIAVKDQLQTVQVALDSATRRGIERQAEITDLQEVLAVQGKHLSDTESLLSQKEEEFRKRQIQYAADKRADQARQKRLNDELALRDLEIQSLKDALRKKREEISQISNNLPLALFSHDKPVTAVAVSDNERTLVTGTYDGKISFWDVRAKKLLSVQGEHKGKIWAIAVSEDGTTVASAGEDGKVVLWDLQKGKPLRTLRGHNGAVVAVAFSPATKPPESSRKRKDKREKKGFPDLVLTGGEDKTARLWSRETGDELSMLKGHTDGVTAVAFSGQGTSVITGSRDLTARVWSVPAGVLSGKPVVLSPHQNELSYVWLNSAGNRALVGTVAGRLSGWVVDSKPPHLLKQADDLTEQFQKFIQEKTGHGFRGQIRAMTRIHDTTYAASVDSDGVVWIWEAFSGRPVQELRHGGSEHKQKVTNAVWFTADGRYVVTASDDGKARLWRVNIKRDAE